LISARSRLVASLGSSVTETTDDLLKLFFGLLDARSRFLDDERDPRAVVVSRRADGQALDVELSAAKQRGDLGEHARFVSDQRGEHCSLGVGFGLGVGVDPDPLCVAPSRRLRSLVRVRSIQCLGICIVAHC